MRITKKVREEAALLCAAAASADRLRAYCGIMNDLGICRDAYNLAFMAYDAVPTEHCLDWRHRDACAEAMLRTGWCP